MCIPFRVGRSLIPMITIMVMAMAVLVIMMAMVVGGLGVGGGASATAGYVGQGRATDEVGYGMATYGAEAALGGAEVIADAFGVHLVKAGQPQELVARLERYFHT